MMMSPGRRPSPRRAIQGQRIPTATITRPMMMSVRDMGVSTRLCVFGRSAIAPPARLWRILSCRGFRAHAQERAGRVRAELRPADGNGEGRKRGRLALAYARRRQPSLPGFQAFEIDTVGL